MNREIKKFVCCLSFVTNDNLHAAASRERMPPCLVSSASQLYHALELRSTPKVQYIRCASTRDIRCAYTCAHTFTMTTSRNTAPQQRSSLGA